jgi:hypothetical protein
MSVHYAVTGITAHGATTAGSGVDFLTRHGTMMFTPPPGGYTPMQQLVSITVEGDTRVESYETLRITLSSPSVGVMLGRAVGTGTIINDDTPVAPLTVGIGDAAVGVGARGSHRLQIPVTLSHKITAAVSVHYSVTALTATYGVDFGGPTSGTVSIAAGSTEATVTALVYANPGAVVDTTLRVTLSALFAPSGSRLVRIRATGTLLHA